jgi:serine/threonine protein kinase/Tfp pilus assembly protein PilF
MDQVEWSRDEQLGEILASCLEAVEAGKPLDRDALLARHPEFAGDLERFLAQHEHIDRLAAPLRDVARAAAPTPQGAGATAVEVGAVVAGTLGDFRIIREVGRGGMGIVYEAEQVSLGRRVALKVLTFAGTLDARQLQRFQNEARAAAGLHHTNIVPVHFVGCERGVHYYAMQFIEGRDLASALTQFRAQAGSKGTDPTPAEPADVPPDQRTAAAAAATQLLAGLSTERSTKSLEYFRTVAQLGIQAAEALDYAHQMGIVHRDVKPANLMVDGAGRLWVTDFGLAQIQSDARLTMTGDLVGTLRYMSPEQALAKRVVVDHRTDVYSLGATLYELLTLEPPFSGGDRQELLRQIAFEEPKPIRRLNRKIPAELETIVLRAMEKNPAVRYATAEGFADDLRRFLQDRPILARRPSWRQTAQKWARRHRAAVAAAAVCVAVSLVAAVGSGAWVLGERAARQQEAEGKVLEALEEAEPGLRAGNPHDPALGAAVQRAEAQLSGGLLGAEPRRQVEQLRRDQQMLAKLEQARLQAAAGGMVKGFDFAGSDQLYAEAFAGYGVEVSALDADEAAERVVAAAIRNHLVVALDHWAIDRELLLERSAAPLRAVADRADDDPWRRRLRAVVGRRDWTALEALAKEEEARTLPTANLVLLAHALSVAGSWPAAERLLSRAQSEMPADFWINFQLANAFLSKKPPELAQAIRFYQAALALQPQSPAVYLNLGKALADQGKLSEAETVFRNAIRLKPDLAEPHANLGSALIRQGRLVEAEKACRKAIELKAELAGAHYVLGNALQGQRKLAEAEKAYHEAIRLKPDLAESYYYLGNALHAQGKPKEAEKACSKAILLNPDFAEAHCTLGTAMAAQGKPKEAEAAFRKAIKLNRDLVDAHYNLGRFLAHHDQPDEAIVEYGEAIRLKKDLPEAHCNLGLTLIKLGRFAEALKALRRGHELGSLRPGWPYPSAQWVRQAEQYVAHADKLPKCLSGESKPADVAEGIALAEICQRSKKLYAAAARFFAGAFAAEPQVADDLNSDHRYHAACAAALAGCGQGKDAANLDTQESALLRKQALDWLRADLAAWSNLLEKAKDKAAPVVLQHMQHWLGDPDFNGVRGAAALAKLPEAERGDWQQLWEEVAALRQRAQPMKK